MSWQFNYDLSNESIPTVVGAVSAQYLVDEQVVLPVKCVEALFKAKHDTLHAVHVLKQCVKAMCQSNVLD